MKNTHTTNADVAAAEELVNRRRSELEAATEKVEELAATLAAGDDSVTALDQVIAAAEVHRATTLLHAATAAVHSTRRRLPWEPEVAEALAPKLADLLRVPVLVVDNFPTEAPDELTAYVRQTSRPRTDHIEGYVSAQVEVALYRTEHHRELNADTVADRLHNEYAVRAQVGHVVSEEHDGVVVDTCPVTVESLALDVPELTGPVQPFRVGWMLTGLEGEIERPRFHYETGRGFVGADVTEERRRTEVDGDTRRVHLTIHADAWPIRGAEREMPEGHIGQRIAEMIGSLPGRHVPAVGRVEAATLVQSGPSERSRYGAAARVDVVLVAREVPEDAAAA